MSNQRLVVGCNYYLTWQKIPKKRKQDQFVLHMLNNNTGVAKVKNSRGGKDVWVRVSDLIFIDTEHNKNKAENLAIDDSGEYLKSLLDPIGYKYNPPSSEAGL